MNISTQTYLNMLSHKGNHTAHGNKYCKVSLLCIIKFRYVLRCYIVGEFNSKILFTTQKKVLKLMISAITRA